MLVAFVVIGIVVGPAGTGWVVGDDQIDLLARLGIAVLVFLVGLRLDLHPRHGQWAVTLGTGLGRVRFTSVVGFVIALALGMEPSRRSTSRWR